MATAAAIKEATKTFYAQLLKILPVDDLANHFFANNFLSIDDKTTLKCFNTRKERAEYLLDNVLLPSIYIGCTEKFDEMLTLMENSDDYAVQFLVQKIREFLLPPEGMIIKLYIIGYIAISYPCIIAHTVDNLGG